MGAPRKPESHVRRTCFPRGPGQCPQTVPAGWGADARARGRLGLRCWGRAGPGVGAGPRTLGLVVRDRAAGGGRGGRFSRLLSGGSGG